LRAVNPADRRHHQHKHVLVAIGLVSGGFLFGGAAHTPCLSITRSFQQVLRSLECPNFSESALSSAQEARHSI
jgi:K+ transporter